MADATVKFGADMRELMRGIAQGQSGIAGFKRGALAAFGDIGAGITGLGTIASGIGGVFSSIAGSVASLGTFVAENLIAPAASMEQLEVAFGVLLKSTDAAKEHLAALVEYSASTPFALEDIAKASKTLLAFGFSGDEVIKVLSQMGDVAALTGGSLGEMAQIVGKVAATGGMDTEVANQLAERAINVRGELAKMYNLSAEQVTKGLSEKAFGLADLLKVIERVTGNGGAFEAGAAKAAETTMGVWSTFLDNLKLAGADLGASMSEAVKPILNKFIGFIQEMKPTLVSLGQVLGGYFTDVGNWLMGLVGDFVENRHEWQAKLEVGLEMLADVVGDLVAAAEVFVSYVGSGNGMKQLRYDLLSSIGLEGVAKQAAYLDAADERWERIKNGEDTDDVWVPHQLRASGAKWEEKTSRRAEELKQEEELKARARITNPDAPTMQAEEVPAEKIVLLDYNAKKVTEAQEEIAKQQQIISNAQKESEWELLSITEKRKSMMSEMARLGASGDTYEERLDSLNDVLAGAKTKQEAISLGAAIKEAKELEATMKKAREASVMRSAELAALEAEAAGYDEKAKAIQKSIALVQREKELMAQGVSQAKAQALAIRELRAQEALNIKQMEKSMIMSRSDKQSLVNAPTVRIGGLGGRVMAGSSSELTELQAQTTSLKDILRYAKEIEKKVGTGTSLAVMA